MKKRKKITQEEPPVVEGFVERNIDEPESPTGKKRITIHTTEDGSIDWERSGDADELVDAVTADPTMLEKLASHPDFQEGDSGDSAKITNEEAGMVLDVLTMLEGVVFGNVSKKLLGMKISKEVIGENFQLNEKDHERQDPLAATGLNMLQEWLQLDPRWRWALFLGMAHGASLIRMGKNCIITQYEKDESQPPNPAMQDNIKKEQVN